MLLWGLVIALIVVLTFKLKHVDLVETLAVAAMISIIAVLPFIIMYQEVKRDLTEAKQVERLQKEKVFQQEGRIP